VILIPFITERSFREADSPKQQTQKKCRKNIKKADGGLRTCFKDAECDSYQFYRDEPWKKDIGPESLVVESLRILKPPVSNVSLSEGNLVLQKTLQVFPKNVTNPGLRDKPHGRKSAQLQAEHHIFRAPERGKSPSLLEQGSVAKEVAGRKKLFYAGTAPVHELVYLQVVLGHRQRFVLLKIDWRLKLGGSERY